MEFFKRSMLQVQDFLGQMSITTRWLIGCLLVIFLFVGYVLMQYAAQPDLMPITRFTTERQPQAVALLRGSGVDVRTESGQLMVPAGQYNEALMLLASGDLLASDTAAAFDEMISRHSPWQSNAQNAQAFLLAKQKVLGGIIREMAGIASASVMLARPQNQGFGKTHVRPSASVNVVMSGGKRVERPLVDAIAGLVSGAIAEMQPQDVVVIDANRGRQFTVKSPNDVIPSETLELVQHLEQRYRDKIAEVLGYIPNVILAVNVSIDPVHSKLVEQYDYESSEPLASEYTRESDRRDVKNSGEPGARPNTGLDIANATGASSSETVSESRNEYKDKNLTRRTHTTETGHNTKRINVTINVPRSYFVGVFKQGKPDDAEDPDDAALAPVVEAQLTQIEAQVKPLVSTDQDEGTVRVHMIPDRDELMVLAGIATPGAPQGGVAGVLGSDWIKPVGLGMLALVSLGIMFSMVRKASQQPVLPSVEELAGVPPKLPGEEDLIGDAEQTETPMDGVELEEEEMHIQKLAEQISELVESDPSDAGALFQRWVNSEP